MAKDIIIIVIAYLTIAFILYKGVFRLETRKAKFSSFKIFTFFVAIGLIADFTWGPFLMNKNLTIEDRQAMEQAIAIGNIFEIFMIFLVSALFTLTINMEFPMIFVIKKKNGQAVITEKRILRKSRNCIVDMNQIVFNFKEVQDFNSAYLKEIRVLVECSDEFLLNEYLMVHPDDIIPGTTLTIKDHRQASYKLLGYVLWQFVILKNIEILQNGSAKELEQYPLSNFLRSQNIIEHGTENTGIKNVQLTLYPKIKEQTIVLK